MAWGPEGAPADEAPKNLAPKSGRPFRARDLNRRFPGKPWAKLSWPVGPKIQLYSHPIFLGESRLTAFLLVLSRAVLQAVSGQRIYMDECP
jgi:hypothetical protein